MRALRKINAGWMLREEDGRSFHRLACRLAEGLTHCQMITLKSFLLSVDQCYPLDVFSFKCITVYMDAQVFVLIFVVQENRILTLTTNVSLLTILWTIRTFEI